MTSIRTLNNYLCHVTELMTSSGSFQTKEKYLYALTNAFDNL